MDPNQPHLDQPVLLYARKDFPILNKDLTVGEALEVIRQKGLGERIIYFYAVNEEGQLVGVIPTRRLLTSLPDTRLEDIMVSKVISIPHTATVLDACEFFLLHKFLAFPIVDEENRIVGVVDINLFAEEVFDLAEQQEVEDVFQWIGFKVSQIRNASPFKVFRYRFPWLAATLTSGILSAILASKYEATLAEAIMLAFFLTLVLGLGESVSIQSMTVTLQNLHIQKLSWRAYFTWLKREILTAILLGSVCGVIVGTMAWVWRSEIFTALSIGLSILLSIVTACILGLSIPALLHAVKLDPKIAAGPITLALADMATLLFYFNVASLILHKG